MTLNAWIMYLTLVLVATLTPGPAVLYITTTATLHGWRKAVFAALGNILGLFCLGIIAVTGLGAILKTSEIVFAAIKYAGAAYLIYLGIRLMVRKDFSFNSVTGRLMPSHVSPLKVFMQALGVAISNPKAIVFLTALFPQFIDVHHTLVPQFTVLISILMTFSFSCLMLYALLAHRAKTWFNRPSVSRNFGRGSGAVFVGFGILLAASSNK